MRRLWVLRRTLRFVSLRAARSRGSHPEPGGPEEPDAAAGEDLTGELTGDPFDDADRRRSAIGRAWFVGEEPPAGGGPA